MWHAARKQERMIRVMMVDYQKRAGRRREYYECIKQDPNQFLRVYGRSMKIHIDPALAAVAEGPQVMQPWQGDPEVQMDRYDVRSHIDYIPPVQSSKEVVDPDENRCNYERYRILVQNDCAGVSEDQCLQQIYHDEQFGASDSSKSEEEKKKKLAEKRAAIGFVYDDGSSGIRMPDFKKEMAEEEEEDEEIDLDNILDIDMLTEEQEQVLNGLSVEYGMEGNDYSEFLQLDRDEMEALRAVKQIEEEKAQFSGRKSRRERRAFKERRLRNRKLSPPSYAAKPSSPKSSNLSKMRESSSSKSRSRSPPGTGVIEFITSFGGNGGNRSSDEGGEKPLQGPSLPMPQDANRNTVGSKSSEKGGTTRSLERRRSRSPQKRSGSPRKRSRSPRRRSPRRRSRGRSRSSRRSRSREKTRFRRSRSRSDEGRSNGYRRDYYRRSKRSRSSSTNSRSSSGRSSSRSCSTSSSYSKSSVDSSHSRSDSGGSTNTPSQAPIKKYRRPSLSSNSGFEDEEDEENNKKDQGKPLKDPKSSKSELYKKVPGRGSVATSKVSSSSTSSAMTPQERLKRRMQLALSKQYKADKKAQIEKQTKEEQMKQDREEELRLLAVQMRQRDRERRHREREERDRLEADHERPRRRSRSSERSRSRKRSRRSTSRGSRSRRSRSRESRSSRSRRRPSSPSPSSSRSSKLKLVDY